MTPETERLIGSGQWLEAEQLTEIKEAAAEAWDAAADNNCPWKVEVDVADLTKLCNELVARREAEAKAST